MKCPHCLKQITHQSWEKRRRLRRELILECLLERMTADSFYNRLIHEGYNYNRKTFQRDLKEMEHHKLLLLDIKIGGAMGSTTFVEPIK